MDSILHLISEYGYLIVLFGVMAESTGVPLPGETILISAGILAQRGRLDLGDAILFGLSPLWRWGGSWLARTRVGLAVVALVVGLGQVYTGAHYPSDVLAGWALGGV
jgi:PAP2 superfamily